MIDGDSWFKFYTRVLDSSKLEELSDKLYRHWTKLCCVACRHGGTLPALHQVAFEMRITKSEAERTIATLVEKRFIDDDGGILTMHDWEDWQFANGRPSSVASSRIGDVSPSTERSRRFRERKKALQEALQQRQNATHATLDATENATPDATQETPCNALLARARSEKRREEKNREETQRNGNATATHATQRNATECNATVATDDFADTIERIALRHPKKSGITSAKQILAQTLASAVDPLRAAHSADATHAAFCASEEWKREGGRYAPKLGNWVRENGFLDPPPSAQQEDEVW